MMKLKPSILRNLFLSFVGFGLLVAIIFPFYAEFFVDWKPGMYVWFVMGCVVAGVSIGLANFYLVHRILLRRLGRMSDTIKAISEKDLSQECTIVSHDIIGTMANSFNHMTRSLRDIIHQLRTDADDLSSAASSMQHAMGTTHDDVNQQQTQIDQVATAVNQLAASSQQVASYADSAATATEEADAQGSNGAVLIVEALGAVDTLAGNVTQAATVVSSLEQESENIGSVLAVINGIAEQTNLLALNAAIEAARAGEQGRGFAVVADEVRTLATRTQQSTEEIKAIIDRLQSGARDAAQNMEQSNHRANECVEMTEKAAEALAEISGSISTIKDMTQQIAAAAAEQSATVETVNHSITSINDIGHQTSEAVNQATTSSDEVSRKSAGLHALVEGFKL